MKIGIIGLGKMGAAIAQRALAEEHEVFGFDSSAQAIKYAKEHGIKIAASLEDLARNVRNFWLMLPAGEMLDTVINNLRPFLKKGDIIIDGGNSNFHDTVRRASDLATDGVYLLDCGTSGGLLGAEIGFSLMIGGDNDAYLELKPIFKAVAAKNSFAHVGPSGAGHYVKMIHNGIEYGLLQAYAEGFHLLKNTKQYPGLDLAQIVGTWRNSSVIRSWLLDLCLDIFNEDQDLKGIDGHIEGGATGRWTLNEAKEQKIPMKLLKDALEIREWSRKTGGNYGTKVVAMLRNKFGGHPVKQKL